MRFSKIIGVALCATTTTAVMDLKVLGAFRQAIGRADQSDANSITFLKFYADNFLWSITELYKSFSMVSRNVQSLEDDLADGADKIAALEDDVNDAKSDYDAKLEEIEDLLETLTLMVDQGQVDLDAAQATFVGMN